VKMEMGWEGKGQENWGLIKTNSQKQFRTVEQCHGAHACYLVPMARLRRSGVDEVTWLASVSLFVCHCVCAMCMPCICVYDCVCVSV
jgi:hypothetical protein